MSLFIASSGNELLNYLIFYEVNFDLVIKIILLSHASYVKVPLEVLILVD